ncbi:Octanoyltransferase [Candidatus Erwinia haradaeae]|uniref:Octanoyltransferase n=1 Tax=Candidatus Erwinia haradaeae TaxID=1922217 RepID=A0A451DJS0_9GAMM|nr:lipoyl(octanoyl) transferase LipB [Candidatus Erwinia haradaeae]VFP86933.1 Octanoyltransferase [Candidatus Erwinia haradaeae]
MHILSPDTLIIRALGLHTWVSVVDAMQQFTHQRNHMTPDEIWLVEHFPVFTQGQTGKKTHLLLPKDIPLMKSDRGGKITYHGPGQQMLYVMINLKRRRIGVHQLVVALEQTVIETLAVFAVHAYIRPGAPGVYIDGKKICSLGLRIRNSCSYHGLAFNINMDLTPFLYIDPCGDPLLEMTQLKQKKPEITMLEVQPILIRSFMHQLGINSITWDKGGALPKYNSLDSNDI